MSSIVKIAWLIPSLPFAIAIFLLILLLSFTRTMNRLTKPVSYILLITIFFSTTLSFLSFQKGLSGQILDWNLNVLAKEAHLSLYIDQISSEVSTIFGIVVLIVMGSSLIFMERRAGYVRYFISLGLISGLGFLFVLSGDPFHSLL